MANKYDIQGQYEIQRIQRDAHKETEALNSFINAASLTVDLLDAANTIYGIYKEDQEGQAYDDFQASKDEIIESLYSYDYETKEITAFDKEGNFYTLADGSTYELQEGDTVKGNTIFSNRVADRTQAFKNKKDFLDGYLSNSGVLEGKSQAYKNAYEQYYNSFKNNTEQTLAENLYINLAQDNKNRALKNANEVYNYMGAENSQTYSDALKNILGENYEGARYEIPKITVENTEETKTEYAQQKMEQDFAIQRNLIYEYYRGAYSEQEAIGLMDSEFISQVMQFEYNNASSTIDSFLKENPYVDTDAYVELKVNTFADTETNPLLKGKAVSQSEKEEYAKKLATLVTQRKAVLSGQISNAVASTLNELYNKNLNGEFISSSVFNQVYDSLGITKEVAYAYMDSSTIKAIEVYEQIGLQNESFRQASLNVRLLSNSDDNVVLSMAQKYGKTLDGKPVETAQEARIAIFDSLPSNVQSYIYDNPYTEEREYILIKSDETYSGFLQNNTDYSKILTLEEQYAQDTEIAEERAISEYYMPKWEAGTMSLDTYDSLGITDNFFQESKKAYEEKIGHEVSNDVYATVLRNEVEDIYKNKLGSNATSKNVTAHKQAVEQSFAQTVEGKLYDISIWELGYGFNASNGIYNEAVDRTYKELGGSNEKASVVDKAVYIQSHIMDTEIKTQDTTDTKEKQHGAVSVDNIDETKTETSFKKIIIARGNEIVAEQEEGLLTMRGTNETLYDSSAAKASASVKDAQDFINAQNEANQKEAEATASSLLSVGYTPTEAQETLKARGVSSEDAKSAVLNAQSTIIDNDGKLSVDLSGFADSFGNTSYTAIQNTINENLDALTGSESNVFSANMIKKNMISQLLPIITNELSKANPNVEKAVSNFFEQYNKVATQSWGSMVSGTLSLSDLDSLGKTNGKEYVTKNLDLSKLNFYQDYANGKAYMMTYNQVIEDGKSLEGNNQIFSLLATDTSLKDDEKQKYAMAYAMNAVFGVDILSLEEVEKMSYTEVKNEITSRCMSSNPLLFGHVTAVASEVYGGSLATEKLAKTNVKYDWLDLSTGTNQKLTFTSTGYIFECQTEYGKPVYVVPQFEKNKCIGFSFYKDENCTQPILCGWQYAMENLSQEQIDTMNVNTVLTYDIYANRNSDDLDKEFLYTNQLMEQKVDTLENIIAYTEDPAKLNAMNAPYFNNKAISTLSKSVTDEVRRTIKEGYENYQMLKTAGQTEYGNILNFDIANGTFLASSYDKSKNSLTKKGNVYTNEKGQTFTMTETGLVPNLTKEVSLEKGTQYFAKAQEIVARSNNEVSFKDAYNAVLYCYEGFDSPCRYVDKDGNSTMYYPAIYEYIAKGYYL